MKTLLLRYAGRTFLNSKMSRMPRRFEQAWLLIFESSPKLLDHAERIYLENSCREDRRKIRCKKSFCSTERRSEERAAKESFATDQHSSPMVRLDFYATVPFQCPCFKLNATGRTPASCALYNAGAHAFALANSSAFSSRLAEKDVLSYEKVVTLLGADISSPQLRKKPSCRLLALLIVICYGLDLGNNFFSQLYVRFLFANILLETEEFLDQNDGEYQHSTASFQYLRIAALFAL
eukprot:IDg12248t1